MRQRRPGYFEAERPRVEVIPMIDIMMFLLVFFVVISLKMIAGTGVPMELPSAASTQQIKSSTVTIGVTKTGETVLEGQVIVADALRAKLAALKPPVEVVVAGDKDVSLQTLLGVMDVVRGAGITTVGLAAKAEAKTAAKVESKAESKAEKRQP